MDKCQAVPQATSVSNAARAARHDTDGRNMMVSSLQGAKEEKLGSYLTPWEHDRELS
jgi:hypothetical protein